MNCWHRTAYYQEEQEQEVEYLLPGIMLSTVGRSR